MTTKYIQLPTCKLAEFVAAATTSFDVSGFLYNDGVTPVDPADIGDVCFATLEPRTAREELISFTIDSVTSEGVATVTVVRGLSQKSPYGTGGAAFDHQNGSDFVISNNPGLFNRLTAKDNEETVTAQWTFPTPTAAGAPVIKSYAEAQFVYKTGDQSIAGVKTFTDKPVVPVATEDGNPIRKDTFDAQTVKLAGAQTIDGVKTFSSSPVIPTAANSTDAVNKGQMESYIAANSGDIKASESAFGTTKLDVAPTDPAEPIAIGANSPINQASRSVDPSDDAGKLVKLENDGYLENSFLRQGFGGNGSDGDLIVSSGTTTIDLGGESFVIKNYTSISITGTGKVAFSNPHANGTVIEFRCKGDVTITSTATPAIDVRGMGAEGGAGDVSSFGGGQGQYPFGIVTDADETCGGYGGFGATSAGGNGAAGVKLSDYKYPYTSSSVQYLRRFRVLPGAGGGGGGASGGSSPYYGSIGGRGGGGFLLEVAGSLNFTGEINASGEDAPDNTATAPAAASPGAGGGGAAGMVGIIYNTLTTNTGTITTEGGAGGTGATGVTSSGNEGGGGGGAASILSGGGAGGNEGAGHRDGYDAPGLGAGGGGGGGRDGVGAGGAGGAGGGSMGGLIIPNTFLV